MLKRTRLLGGLAAVAAVAPASALAASTPHAARKATAVERSLRASPVLWATIDVCNPTDQPDTVGVRGSMPGDGKAHDTLYMRFRLQYLSSTLKRWVDLAPGAVSGNVKAGSAKSARQAGWSFQLMPVAGKPASTLRGVVTFQWRHGSVLVASISRATTAGHESLAGADPPNFSAATCAIG